MATASAATLTPAGLPAITLHSTVPGVAKGAQLRLALGKGPVGLSTVAGRSVASIAAALKAAAAAVGFGRIVALY